MTNEMLLSFLILHHSGDPVLIFNYNASRRIFRLQINQENSCLNSKNNKRK